MLIPVLQQIYHALTGFMGRKRDRYGATGSRRQKLDLGSEEPFPTGKKHRMQSAQADGMDLIGHGNAVWCFGKVVLHKFASHQRFRVGGTGNRSPSSVLNGVSVGPAVTAAPQPSGWSTIPYQRRGKKSDVANNPTILPIYPTCTTRGLFCAPTYLPGG